MATNFPATLTLQYQNNQPQPTVVNLGVIKVVIDGAVVIDPKDINPGVITNTPY